MSSDGEEANRPSADHDATAAGEEDIGHRAEVAPYVELRVHRGQERLRLHGVAGRGWKLDRPAVRDDAAHADARCPVRAEQEIHGQAVDRRSGARPAARGPLNEVADAVHHGHLVHELDRLRDCRPAAHDEVVTGVSEQLRPVALSGLNGPVTFAPARGRDHPIRTGCPGQVEPALRPPPGTTSSFRESRCRRGARTH